MIRWAFMVVVIAAICSICGLLGMAVLVEGIEKTLFLCSMVFFLLSIAGRLMSRG